MLQGSQLRRVVLLAGGVGGARMAEGLALALPPNALTVIGNVADDETFYGLHVSPDIDTIVYTLSDRIDRSKGWGVSGDTTNALGVLAECGAPVWMTLGDKDLGLHIWRTFRLTQGETLTSITEDIAARLAARARVLPVTDDRVRTRLQTPIGWMDFQTWFVRERGAPAVSSITYDGAATAVVTAQAAQAIKTADAVIIAPSNPFLSIAPILAVPGLRELLSTLRVPRIAVSPLIGGKPVKGPLGNLLRDLNRPNDTSLLTSLYAGLIDAVVIDDSDRKDAEAATATGIEVLTTDILMPNASAARVLGARICSWLRALPGSRHHGAAT